MAVSAALSMVFEHSGGIHDLKRLIWFWTLSFGLYRTVRDWALQAAEKPNLYQDTTLRAAKSSVLYQGTTLVGP
jgi:hypothetical protein